MFRRSDRSPRVSSQITSNLLNIQIARSRTTTVRIGFSIGSVIWKKRWTAGGAIDPCSLIK